ARRNEKFDDTHLACCGSKALCLPKCTVPMPYPGKRVTFATRVEYNDCHRRLIQMELVNQSISWLPGQIPKQRFSDDLTRYFSLRLRVVQCPNTPRMS